MATLKMKEFFPLLILLKLSMIVDSLLVLPDYNDKTPALRLFYYSPTVEQQMRISAHYNDAPAAFEARDRTEKAYQNLLNRICQDRISCPSDVCAPCQGCLPCPTCAAAPPASETFTSCSSQVAASASPSGAITVGNLASGNDCYYGIATYAPYTKITLTCANGQTVTQYDIDGNTIITVSDGSVVTSTIFGNQNPLKLYVSLNPDANGNIGCTWKAQ